MFRYDKNIIIITMYFDITIKYKQPNIGYYNLHLIPILYNVHLPTNFYYILSRYIFSLKVY